MVKPLSTRATPEQEEPLGCSRHSANIGSSAGLWAVRLLFFFFFGGALPVGDGRLSAGVAESADRLRLASTGFPESAELAAALADVVPRLCVVPVLVGMGARLSVERVGESDVTP